MRWVLIGLVINRRYFGQSTPWKHVFHDASVFSKECYAKYYKINSNDWSECHDGADRM